MVDIDKAAAKRIAKSLFPEYRGRSIRVHELASYTMKNYWGGGTRAYVKALNLETMEVRDPNFSTSTPWNAEAHATFEIPAGVALVEHAFFQGRDCGITIYVAPRKSLEASTPVHALEGGNR